MSNSNNIVENQKPTFATTKKVLTVTSKGLDVNGPNMLMCDQVYEEVADYYGWQIEAEYADLFRKYVSMMYCRFYTPEFYEQFKQEFEGEYKSPAAFAEHYAEQNGDDHDTPYYLRYAVDWAKAASLLRREHGYFYMYVEESDMWYVFNNGQEGA